MLKIKLHWQILIGIALGVLYGIFLTDQVHYVDWLGKLFLRALKMIIIPLIMSSIISGVANLGGGPAFKKMGSKTLAYYLTTSIFAILIGSVLVNAFEPGVGLDISNESQSSIMQEESGDKIEKLKVANEEFSFIDRIVQIVPVNIFKSIYEMDMLGIIFFSILIGIFIPSIDTKYRDLFLKLSNGSFELVMKIVMFIIKLSPLGIFGLMASVIGEQAGDKEHLIKVFSSLGTFSIIVLAGLLIHAIVVLPSMLYLLGKINPIKHFKAMRTPLLTAFSTSSSSATMPLTLSALKKEVGVSDRVSSFVIPLGATINMDGTALYEIVGTIFIAQAYGLDLTFTQQILIIVTALLASIGAAAVPMAGLIMMSIILSAVGLPLDAVGLILAVDRILDMFRTTVNVWSDSCGCAIIAKTEGESLKY